METLAINRELLEHCKKLEAESKEIENDERTAILEEIASFGGRCTGESTRLMDSYIQELYNHKGEWIKIVDHYGTPAANKILLGRIAKRMADEHPFDTIEVNNPNNSIKLVHSVNDSINDRIKILRSYLDYFDNKKGQ